MKIKEVVLAVAIIILTIFVTFYGINTIFPKHDYSEFCGEYKTAQVIESASQCEAVGGMWTPQDIRCITEPCPQGYCDRDYECRQNYEDASQSRARNVFFLALPLGILIVVLGLAFFGMESVGAGIMGGGVGTLIYGSGAYWPYTENWIRFLLSLVGLVALIWFSYYLANRPKKRRKKG